MGAIARDMAEAGDAFTTAEHTVTVGAANSDVQLCQANPLRWGLILSVVAAAAGGTVFLNASTLTGQAVKGGVSIGTGSPLVLNFRSHPALVGVAWFGNNPAGAGLQVQVIEEIALSGATA